MKKFIAMILVLVLICAVTSNAMAALSRFDKWFDIVTTSTTEFQTGCSGIYKSDNRWYIVLSESSSNLSATHRAVARVHKGSTAASATWVYSGPSSTVHPYTANCQGYQENLSFRGRLDNRDSGLLEFHGYFYYYFDPHSR